MVDASPPGKRNLDQTEEIIEPRMDTKEHEWSGDACVFRGCWVFDFNHEGRKRCIADVRNRIASFFSLVSHENVVSVRVRRTLVTVK